MKKIYIFIFTITFAFSANAQFSGDYSPDNWSLSGMSANSDASVDISGAPGTIIFNGNDSDFGDCCDLTDDYSISVPTTGYISFSFDWVNQDIEEFYYVVNGTETLISDDSLNGSISDISVSAGDVFAFRIYTDDDCCGRGEATISAFVFDTTLSVDENTFLSSEFNLYPTANSGAFTMVYSGKDNLEKLSVFNTSGNFVKEVNLKNFNNNEVLDLTNLANGLYIVTIDTSKGRINKKIVL